MNNEKRRSLIIYPYLLAIYPILALASRNKAEVGIADIAPPLAIALGAAIILFLLFGAITKDSKRASFIVALFFVFFWEYGHVLSAIREHVPGGRHFTTERFQVFWVYSLIVIVIEVIRRRPQLFRLTQFLNIFAAVFVIFPLFAIITFKVSYDGNPRTYQRWRHFVQSECKKESLRLTAASPQRDIYYIILDEYGREDKLKQQFGLDNSPFLKSLTQKGFYVADSSTSNYLNTCESLSSSLNMDYLDTLAKKQQTWSTQRDPQLFAMLRDNSVARLLQNKGYKYVFITSGWQVSNHNSRADVLKRPLAPNESQATLLGRSLLCVSRQWTTRVWRKHTNYAFDQLAQIPKIKQPTFTFAHIVCPHTPFVFKANGNAPDEDQIPESYMDRGKLLYPDQLQYVNKRITQVVDTIIAESEVAPIIVIQADHGVRFLSPKWVSQKEYGPGEAENIRSIFNAYYLPDGGDKPLYPSISPVNSFRLIFNYYFGADYKLLEDSTHEVKWSPGKPAKFVRLSK
ncbi:MAG: LTA synthase family protein [Armatimonadetes bacterium]|nr:LTA synthase family protein [Armatimonadota bacterium]